MRGEREREYQDGVGCPGGRGDCGPAFRVQQHRDINSISPERFCFKCGSYNVLGKDFGILFVNAWWWDGNLEVFASAGIVTGNLCCMRLMSLRRISKSWDQDDSRESFKGNLRTKKFLPHQNASWFKARKYLWFMIQLGRLILLNFLWWTINLFSGNLLTKHFRSFYLITSVTYVTRM